MDIIKPVYFKFYDRFPFMVISSFWGEYFPAFVFFDIFQTVSSLYSHCAEDSLGLNKIFNVSSF